MAVDTSSILNKAKGLMTSIGRAAVHELFPNDVEFYALSLELTDYEGNTIDYFAWPILPKNFTKTENNRINVKKSFSSVTVINSKSFTPQDIVIRGDFGKAFKILIQKGNVTTFKGLKFSINAGVWKAEDTDESKLNKQYSEFDISVKTGYGCIKILQAMIDKASGTDDKGRPFKLFLYNPPLGESYLVVPSPNALVFTQNDTNQNMIWAYTLNLIAIAPVSGNNMQGSNTSLVNVLALDNVQKATQFTVSTVRSVL